MKKREHNPFSRVMITFVHHFLSMGTFNGDYE